MRSSQSFTARRRLAGDARSRRHAGTVVAVVVLACTVLGCSNVLPSPPAMPGSGSPSPTTAPTPTNSPTPTPVPTPVPSAMPRLPALLGAIGDSYTQAYSVDSSHLRDHTEFSWVVGTNPTDGVFSLYERFVALGDTPTVVDAATSGRKMNDAARQATAIVQAAAKLPAGATAYVTFELSANDICDDPMTTPDSFASSLDAALAILNQGLPAGSRILMLSVPDYRHWRDMVQADPATAAAYQKPVNQDRCPPFLGSNTRISLADAGAMLDAYNAHLRDACDQIQNADGADGKLACTYNEDLLSERDFLASDLSTVDLIHPNLSGQAKMAQSAWQADVWSNLVLPPSPGPSAAAS